MKRILCFGDSNTWGYVPAKGTRYPYEARWTGVAAGILKNEYLIIEDGINGRTTVFEDPHHPKRCGLDALGYALLSQYPLDLVIVALGTNDLKFTDPTGHKNGLRQIIDTIYDAKHVFNLEYSIFSDVPRILVIAPPRIAPEIEQTRSEHMLAHAAPDSAQIQDAARQIAEEKKTYYLDASAIVYPSLEDCLHLSAGSHEKLGRAVAQKILEIFQPVAGGSIPAR